MTELSAISRCRLFGVRHHSPRAARVLGAFLERHQPEVVLIEAPHDAEGMIEVLVDPGTEPPVAILGYRTDGTPGSSLWPFASYSPEYQALLWAKAKGARAHFIDLSIGQALASQAAPHADGDDAERGDEATAADDPASRDPGHAAALARGLRSFEELWEADFEAPLHDPDTFHAAVLAYAEAIRDQGRPTRHRARDALMGQRILATIDAGTAPEKIAVIAGAAHVAAFLANDVDPAAAGILPKPVPHAVTVIPYSFPRLAEQLGYGAGNRAPHYYQRAHDAGCDFHRATLEVLVEVTEHLRLRGFMASLADTIEAYRLATMLAGLRQKAAPGLNELEEAVTATLLRGDPTHAATFLWPSIVGRRLGKVAARIGQNSLQEEFWREVRARKLPATDEPERFSVRLTNPVEIETSVFLHRLRLAEVPYAGFLGQTATPNRGKEKESVGGHAALVRAKETWEAQWTPATDVALVEGIIKGETLLLVAEVVLREQLQAATTTGVAAEHLLDAVVASCPLAVALGLDTVERHAATDEDLPSLARAARALGGLLSFGSSRGRSALGDRALAPMLQSLFTKAVLRAPLACQVDDAGIGPIRDALTTLHDLAQTQPAADRALWLETAQGVAESWAVNPACAGLCTALLYLAQVFDEDKVAAQVSLRLSTGAEPAQATGYLEGFFSVNALVLVKNRPVVAALDHFLGQIPAERFKDTLPVLRRAFSVLGATERRYLLENVVALRNLGKKAQAVKAVLVEKDKEALKAVSADLSKVMDDLDDLL